METIAVGPMRLKAACIAKKYVGVWSGSVPNQFILRVRDNVCQFVFSSNSGGPKVFVSKNVYILDFHLKG